MSCCSRNQQSQTTRTINIPNTTPSNNRIQTTKYTLLTFFPKAILIQFLRAANYIYLLSAILNFLPIISSSSPVVSLAPFVVILMISLVRQGFEDYKRHKNDKIINESKTKILVNDSFTEVDWSSVKVGDYVKVTNGQNVPVDMILLNSTQENGIGYVQTANLDGERNLKPKFCIDNAPKIYPEQYLTLQCSIIVQTPNRNLHNFSGSIKFQNGQYLEIGKDHLLLRGTVLKNTHQVVGLAVYTGHQTKIMMNQGNFKTKTTLVERRVNVIQLILGVVLILMCILMGIMHYKNIPIHSLFYLSPASKVSDQIQAAATAVSCFLLLNVIVPISLNISIQIIKTMQADFYSLDHKMTCNINQQQQPCKVLNSLIIQELGNVSFILTDKTGTLTSNTMQFRELWVQGNQYTSEDLSSAIQFKQQVLVFWIYAVICHDAIIDTESLEYQGSSADQVCFLEFGSSIGYKFLKRTKTHVQIQIKGHKLVYQLLMILPFSQRKMMSVIIRNPQTSQIISITKGADSSIFSHRNTNYPQNKLDSINLFLTRVSKQGLRTLVFSQRVIPESDFSKFMINYHNFMLKKKSNSLQKIEEEELELKLFQIIQSNLNIVGATAIQDKLQEGVPECISNFREAGIKVVMITGDKLETAENIGYLSNFIGPKAEVYKLRQSMDNLQNQVQNIAHAVEVNKNDFSFIIEGQIISQIISSNSSIIIQSIRSIVQKCNSVIFCRSTPAEKALIVQFFKKTFFSTILAIGDGGNDVNMIKQADIGIGIIGKEGNQAAYSSDVYIGQFKYLERLLFHHGRMSYNRISYFFVYFGFKSNIITLLLFLYLFYCGYSAQYSISQLYQGCFNSFIGIIPTMYLGIFEQDLNVDQRPQTKNLLPQIYKQCRLTDLFSYKRYFIWTIFSIICSCWLFFTSIYVLNSMVSLNSNGFPSDWISMSTSLQFSSCLIVMGILAIDLQVYNWWTLFCIGGGAFFASFVVFIIQNFALIDNFDDCFWGFSNNFNYRFWALNLVLTSGVLIPKIVYKAIEYEYFPSLVKQARKMHNEIQGSTTDSNFELKIQIKQPQE